MAEDKSKYVGRSVKRVEDLRLLSGQDSFLDNLKMQNMAFAGFVRSPYAYARIKSIDGSEIEGDPALVGYVLPAEVEEKTEQVPALWLPFGIKAPAHYSLAKEYARYVGEPIVAVVVRDRKKLEDVIEKIKIEYDVLNPLVDPFESAKETAPVLHSELGSNVSYQMSMGNGDPADAISFSPVVIEEEFKLQRLAANPMETRGVLASYESGHLTMYSSTQWPHLLRTCLARGLRTSENTIRVIAPDVGGGFGVKDEIYPEEFLTALLALKFKIPIKWSETRSESFQGIAHARDQIIKTKMGLSEDGRINGLKVEITCDFGAYLQAVGAGSPFITALSLDGPYVFPVLSVDFRGVFTNKVPLSAYRGFGESEAAFVIERLMDIAASKLGIESVKLRFNNLVQPSQFPYHTSTGGIYDSGDYPKCLEEVLRISKYREKVQSPRLTKEGKIKGYGVSVYNETTGFAPSAVFGEMGLLMGGYDSATVKVDPMGKVTIFTGAFPHGQGFNTTLSQICADELGLDLSDITAYHGDTSSAPYGHGSFGSRTIAVCGTAAIFACRQIKAKMAKIAAHKLGQQSIDFEFSNGYLISASEKKRIPFAEIAHEACVAHHLPQDIPPGLEATHYYDPVGLETSYAAHVCEVEADPETGMCEIVGYWIASDCGKVVNPAIVEGQLQGGVAQAIGQALFEEVVYTQDGQIASSSFVDYLLPVAENVPNMDIVSMETPSPLTPLGVKGVGESGTIIGPPAVINAICDALKINLVSTPAKPEVVFNALKTASKSRSK